MARILEGKNNITGENIKKLRIKARLSQQQLSDRLETMAVYVCRGSLSRIENGERTVTDMEVEAIARALDVPLAALFKR
ncbi:MAG: helix-turn-helix domain-containing protein [Oscillospiraceae bacterium]|nr:helix-turn-helix domain-containing protein [Oscillospiraceae bacterium]